MWAHFGHGDCDTRGRRRGGPWDFDPAFWGGIFGGGAPGRGGWGPFRRGRMFEQGDLRFVILRLLDEKPRHGYEIIKALEERFAGMYSPSPGTVYPTLTMLEDLGYAKATPEEGGKKIYEITPEGRAYLAENRDTVEEIFERIAEFGAGMFGDAMHGVKHAFADLARTTWRSAARAYGKGDRLKRIAEILERAAKEIEKLD